MALWALLTVTKFMVVPILSIFGNSLVIITWATGKSTLNLPHLSHWSDETRDLLQSFPGMIMKHIFREHNQTADSLSKKDLTLDSGYGTFIEVMNDITIDHGIFRLF